VFHTDKVSALLLLFLGNPFINMELVIFLLHSSITSFTPFSESRIIETPVWSACWKQSKFLSVLPRRVPSDFSFRGACKPLNSLTIKIYSSSLSLVLSYQPVSTSNETFHIFRGLPGPLLPFEKLSLTILTVLPRVTLDM
jgi:hypothetical protein